MSARLRITAFATFVFTGAALVVLAAALVVVRNFPIYPLTEQNLPSRQEILTAMLGIAGTVTLFVIVFGCCAAWLAAGMLLGPLDRLRATAMQAADGDLTQRVGLRRRDEFGRLAGAFDTMLDRLEGAVEAQRRFAANAAHELRTPLAVVRTVADVARSMPDGDHDEALRRIAVTNDRAIETCEALLELAAVNAVVMHRVDFMLRQVIDDAIDEVAPALVTARVTLDVRVADAVVVGDARLLRQAIRNLLDNVARHGDAGPAVLSADRTRRHARIRVENAGPVLDPEIVSRLTEPFLRAAGRTTDGAARTGGHGLGLALVERVAVVHGGTLVLAARPGGGLIAELRLPR